MKNIGFSKVQVTSSAPAFQRDLESPRDPEAVEGKNPVWDCGVVELDGR